MAFRATNDEVGKAYFNIKRQASDSKEYLTRQRALMVNITCNSGIPLSVIQHFGQVVDMFAAWAATPGLAQYAKDQENDPAYDVVAEFTTMNNAMVAARDSLITMFPKDGNGFLLYQTLNVKGQASNRLFTNAQLAPAVTLIDGVIATIS